jgi:hypothetical protein
MNPDTVAAPMGSYSHAVRVETSDAVWIFVAGQIATDADGNLVGPGDLGPDRAGLREPPACSRQTGRRSPTW